MRRGVEGLAVDATASAVLDAGEHPEPVSHPGQIRRELVEGVGVVLPAREVAVGGFRPDTDNDPEFTSEPAPEDFAQYLEYVLRDDEHIPEWLRERIRAAGEGSE
ncbi:hypothetical protein GCM10009800_02750 [Nocardiopsis rhodophaea]